LVIVTLFCTAAIEAGDHPYRPAPHSQEATMAGKTILIIEDDTLHRDMLTTALSKQGFSVVTATEGNEALNLLSSRPVPDLIFLDMLLRSGNFDGWWFLHQRQHIPALAAIPVVITTALIVASEEWAGSLGASGLLRKPFDSAALLAEVHRLLGDAGGEPTLSPCRDSPLALRLTLISDIDERAR
jgi:CheY-like chemotaxis protein